MNSPKPHPIKDGPPGTRPKDRKPDEKGLDVDDAMIEKPKDDAFEHKAPEKAPSR